MFFAILTGRASFLFFASCTLKIPHGGYWSLIIASVPLFIVVLYTAGQKRLYKSFVPVEKNTFLHEYSEKYANGAHISGTALFFARHASAIPAYIPKTMFQNGIIYDRNIIVVVKPANEPHGIDTELTPLSEGLDLMMIYPGYMEMLDVEEVLNSKGI